MKPMAWMAAAFSLQLTLAIGVLKLIVLLDHTYKCAADKTTAGVLAAGCCAGVGVIFRNCPQGPPMLWLVYSVLAVYLTICVLTDLRACIVYDFLQLPGAMAGAMLCLSRPLPAGSGAGLVLFALLQYLLFGRLYGIGDAMVFQVCSLYLAGRGGDLRTFLLHMALAFVLLGIVQSFRRNINKRGNLKTPVPFVPYIACSLLWFL